MSPPYLRISASRSCGTDELPCITRCVFGMRAWIALIRSIARMSPVGLRVNLYAPCDVPMAIASASSCVRCDEVGGLLGIGQQHLARHRALGAVAVLLVAHHRLERAEAAELAFDGHADAVRQVDDLAGHVDVVVVVGDASCRPRAASRPSSPTRSRA